jgi:hypothetical protein
LCVFMLYCFASINGLIVVLQVKWENRYDGDLHNDCLVSVDGTDFQIPYFGRKFHSHKYKFGSALRYEIAVCILSGVLVWINGPYEPGIWNDISIFRNALLQSWMMERVLKLMMDTEGSHQCM